MARIFIEVMACLNASYVCSFKLEGENDDRRDIGRDFHLCGPLLTPSALKNLIPQKT